MRTSIPGLYTRRVVPVRHGASLLPALVYILRRPGEGTPRPAYVHLVVTAARDWGLPERYVDALQRWSPSGWRHASKGHRRDPMSTAHIVRQVVIRGRVQRVGYRAWAEHVALQRGLEGWVRNRSDGAVEAVFAGPASVVEGMIEACRRGPPGAQVDALDHSEGSLDDVALRRRGEMFSVLPTD
jgi:acylphosphatase